MSDTVEVSREIAAPAERVWGLVSDLPRMGEWSDENVGGRWVGVPAGPVPGAEFRGHNRNGARRWSTKATVEESVPGEVFSFRVDLSMLPISTWTYVIEPTSGGCRVTERWVDRRPRWFRPLAHVATGVGDRAKHTRASIENTLERVAAAAESAESD